MRQAGSSPDGRMDGETPVFMQGGIVMAIALDQYYLDGDALDVLEACDELTMLLGRLRRLGRMPETDWITSTRCLAEIHALVEAGLTH
jgi:hypothetical protein